MSQDKQSQKGMSTWVWLALLTTLVLTLWTASQEDEAEDTDAIVVVSDQPRSEVTSQVNATASTEALLPPNRLIDWDKLARKSGLPPKNLFSPADWTDKKKFLARRAEKAPPPPPPQAPPLPFSYMGRMDDGPNGNVIYLADQEKSYTVKIGSKVGQSWRLDQEDKNSLHFTYLPLNLTRSLSKQATSAAGFN